MKVDKGTSWTEEQLLAINVRGRNLLVAAAAGAGKTAVLVERVLRLVTDPADPVDIDRLLVVTFTEAAAAGMRTRLGRSLEAALDREPGNNRLERQLALLDRASISTIHSFCLTILRRHFHRLGLDPSFRVAGEAEIALLRLRVLEEIFEGRYHRGDELFLDLVDSYGGRRGDDRLMEVVLALHDFAMSLPGPGEWLRGMVTAYDLSPEASMDDLPWTPVIKAVLGRGLEAAAGELALALHEAGLPGGPVAYLPVLQEELREVLDVHSVLDGSWEEMRRNWGNLDFRRLPPARGRDLDQELKETVRERRDAAKKRLEKLAGLYLTRPGGELLDELRCQRPVVGTLAGLVDAFGEAFARAKHIRSLVDFADLEHLCLRLLTDPDSQPKHFKPSDAAREIREHYAGVLVDEYQDINPVQEAILQLVSRHDHEKAPNLFTVGDVKQSIYRFRLADPRVFISRYNQYAISGDGRNLRVNLKANFRSRPGVVDAVNFIFRQVMNLSVGEVAYDSAAELVAHANYPSLPGGEPPVELYILDRKGDVDEGEMGDAAAVDSDIEELEGLEAEGRHIARRIQAMISDEGTLVWDAGIGDYRPLRYRDVVVLMRATANRADILLEQLRLEGVPAYGEVSRGYFGALEVETMLALLQIVDNPRQDIPLAAVLRSPLVGMDAKKLALIRLAGGRKGDYYDALMATAAGERGEVSLQLQSFLQRLETWRTAARREPLSSLIWRLYRETGYLDYVGGLPGGAQRQANLRALYDRARQFEEFATSGLFNFLRFFQHLRESRRDMGTARSLGEAEDVVRVMSIHKSKGLEFPVVIVAGMGSRFHAGYNSDVGYHRDLGIGLAAVNLDLRLKYNTLAQMAVAEERRAEDLAEEMRVLYVALTRARERLILVGSTASLAARCRYWCSAANVKDCFLPGYHLAAAGSHLDWVASALVRHADGEVFRRSGLTGTPPIILKDPSRWSIRVVGGVLGETGVKSTVVDPGETPEVQDVDPSLIQEVGRLISWEYPLGALDTKSAKVTASEMGRREPGDMPGEYLSPLGPNPAVLPRFMQDTERLTAAERGTAMHLVMQHLNLECPHDEGEVNRQLQELVTREVLTPRQAQAVDPTALVYFWNSPLGKRILERPGNIKREVAFSLAIPAREIYPDLATAPAANEPVLVQGMIDCVVFEDDGLVLIDFKTDNPGRRSLEELAARYKGQMSIYARALETIYGLPVKEKVLFFLEAGKAVNI